MSSSNHDDEEEMLPFFMDYLPTFALEKAELELKETPENRVRCLAELKLMTKANKSTCDINFHDDFLRQFLRRCKHDVSKSFTHLHNFVHLRRKYAPLFESVAAEDLLTKASYKFGTVLPKRCPEGCAIVYCQIGKFDPDEMSVDDFKRMAMMLFLQPLRDPMTQINGYKIIHDFKGTSLKHAKLCTPQNMMFQYHTAMDCFPGRYKEIHFINESIMLRVLWSIVKNFISPKIRSRVFFHSSPDELFDYFPRSVIPSVYGGDLKDYFMEDYLKEMNEQYGECTMEGQVNYF